ncbi:MAG: hypothetical protein KA803_08825, partial [Rhodoferax sp.]|nr:hypothetical protein [Rhodoferax sp.]
KWSCSRWFDEGCSLVSLVFCNDSGRSKSAGFVQHHPGTTRIDRVTRSHRARAQVVESAQRWLTTLA